MPLRRLTTGLALAAAAAAALAPSAAQALPAGMHYELVSPANTGGTVVNPTGLAPQSPDGSRIRLDTGWSQGFDTSSGEPTSMTGGLNNVYVATRTSSGWRSVPTNVSGAPDLFESSAVDASHDLVTSLLQTRSRDQQFAGQEQLAVTSLDAAERKLEPVLANRSGGVDQQIKSAAGQYRGASDDFSHVFVATAGSNRFLLTDAGSSISKERLYEVLPDAGVLRRVDVDEAGTVIGQACGATFGFPPVMANAVSRDGSRVFFTAQPGQDVSCSPSARGRLFARVDGAHTVEVSASECTPGCTAVTATPVYQGASADGTRVVFTSTDQLANTDTDATADLYLYDFTKTTGPKLTQLSAGDGTDATPGAGATVQGVVQVSADGSRVYFVARDVLTTAPNALGQAAAAASNNLYVVDTATGATKFVATLDAGDSSLWSAVFRAAQLADDAGRTLVFSAVTAIAGTGDSGSTRDVFRYDAQAGTLVKVSPTGTGADASIDATDRGSASVAQSGRVVSVDGSRILFATTAALQGEDTNLKSDYYLWTQEGGGPATIALVGDGQDPLGVSAGSLSSDGSQVAFATTRRLVPEDNDDAIGAYVARTGNDIERQPPSPRPGDCDPDACQGEYLPPPVVPDPGAPADGGAGNLPVVDPTYRVPKLSAAARAQLAKTGSAKLAVTVSEAGQVVATGTGQVNKQTTTVASAKATATKGGVVNLTLKLTKAARSQLASAGKLTVKLSVTFSKVAPVQTQSVKLTKAKPKAKAKKKTNKRASSKSAKRKTGR